MRLVEAMQPGKLNLLNNLRVGIVQEARFQEEGYKGRVARGGRNEWGSRKREVAIRGMRNLARGAAYGTCLVKFELDDNKYSLMGEAENRGCGTYMWVVDTVHSMQHV